MKARDFFEQFNARVSKSEQAKECYNSHEKFTDFVIPEIEKILKCNKEEVKREYYRIDLFSWTDLKNELQTQTQKPEGFDECCWAPATAVEHENNYLKWLDEVVKLAYINAPLRIVIGYLPVGKPHTQHIDYVSQVYSFLQERSKFAQCDNNCEFLLIIGNAKVTETNQFFKYKPYLYNSETSRFELQSNWK